jgi:hypothetical protein
VDKLYLILQESGQRSFALRFRKPNGKPAKLTLGPVDVSGVEPGAAPSLDSLGGPLTTVHTVLRAETPRADWAAGGVESLPVKAPELQLTKDWQTRVIGAVGNYGDLYRRNLGEDSPYRLPRGLNAPWQEGGLILAPYSE